MPDVHSVGFLLLWSSDNGAGTALLLRFKINQLHNTDKTETGTVFLAIIHPKPV